MSKILGIVKVTNNKPNNIKSLQKVNINKYAVWLHIKCGYFSYLVKTNNITFNKYKAYANNLKCFYCNNFDRDSPSIELVTKKKLTIFESDTAVKQIVIYEEFPRDIIKRYIKEIKFEIREYEKHIKISKGILAELLDK